MDGMDHGTMDHGGDTEERTASPGPDMETPPPPEAGSGPPRAADAIWGAEAMRPAREALKRVLQASDTQTMVRMRMLAVCAAAEGGLDMTVEALLGELATQHGMLDATQARWDVGAVSLFEVEDARRQLAESQDSAIAAAHDSSRAWVALVRASGHATAATQGGLLS